VSKIFRIFEGEKSYNYYFTKKGSRRKGSEVLEAPKIKNLRAHRRRREAPENAFLSRLNMAQLPAS